MKMKTQSGVNLVIQKEQNINSRMVKVMKKKSLVAAALIFSGVSCSVYEPGSMTVYYIPFSVETYTPVTQDDIFCDYKIKYSTDVKNKIMVIYGVVVSSKKTTEVFDGSLVRVKALFDKETIHIDRNGVFERGGYAYQVDREAFSSFMKDNAAYANKNLYNDPECKYQDD